MTRGTMWLPGFISMSLKRRTTKPVEDNWSSSGNSMRIHDLIDIYHLTPASINLMLEKTAQNDPFYAQVVKSYYAEARSRHPKLFFVEKYKYGFSLCKMPVDFETYFSLLESPARGNHRKALRLGYEMKRIDFY